MWCSSSHVSSQIFHFYNIVGCELVGVLSLPFSCTFLCKRNFGFPIAVLECSRSFKINIRGRFDFVTIFDPFPTRTPTHTYADARVSQFLSDRKTPLHEWESIVIMYKHTHASIWIFFGCHCTSLRLRHRERTLDTFSSFHDHHDRCASPAMPCLE